MKQILKGYDDYIEYGNPYGRYKNDGTNPCIVDEYYASYISDQLSAEPPSWDYVVLVDQTKRMAISNARNTSLSWIVKNYGPLLNASNAIPVIIQPHAFSSSKTNMTGLGNVPGFTKMISDGVNDYAEQLRKALPRSKRPIVSPVGMAFLTIWEEDYDLWKLLFIQDEMHPSIYGTYLICCVLYMTLFNHRLPDTEVTHPENVPELFEYSRKLSGQQGFPSAADATYMRHVARRVVLKGYVPPSFKTAAKQQ